MVLDVFNGDADGILSLVQLRKCQPVAANEQRLITGVKRDIQLLQQIPRGQYPLAAITVLDISFDKNQAVLLPLLEDGHKVFYCDHHQANTLFSHQNLEALIDTRPTVCTALLINQYLQQAQPLWAVAAAFGDGLDKPARELAAALGLSEQQQEQLKQFGVLINYNGYGACEEDLHIKPADLFRTLMQYPDPFAVIADQCSPFAMLQQAYQADLLQAQKMQPFAGQSHLIAVKLDNAPWAARISGTYGNILAAAHPEKAIVIASDNADGSLTISLRAPKQNPRGAAALCSQFATGGGREGAAGINQLARDDLALFIQTVQAAYQ